MLTQQRLMVRRQHKVRRYKIQKIKRYKTLKYPFKIHCLGKGDLDNYGVLVMSICTSHVLTVTLD